MLTLLSFVLATLTPVESVEIPVGITAELRHQALLSRETGLESFYCLIGKMEGTHVVVTGVVKPKQVAFTTTNEVVMSTPLGPLRKREFKAAVNHAACPMGTVMDLHTHPFGTLIPSEVDVDAWSRTPYQLHGIIAALPDGSGRVIFVIWNRDGTKTVDDVRSVPNVLD